jgi:hypothetical protein
VSLNDLQFLFGKCLAGKLMERPSKHQLPGKHTGRHFTGEEIDSLCMPHPAGTKLVRRFIRQSGKESTYNRRLYAYLTGHQYK